MKHTGKLTLLAFVSPKRIEILVHERKFGGEIFQREIKIHSNGFVRLVPAALRNPFTGIPYQESLCKYISCLCLTP